LQEAKELEEAYDLFLVLHTLENLKSSVPMYHPIQPLLLYL